MSTVTVNHWPDDACAKAFWGQHELPPYRRLLADTADWLAPCSGERWLDLGCGGGHLTRVLWEKSKGRLAEVVSLDCAVANADAICRLRTTLTPPADVNQVRFVQGDFSSGLSAFADGTFDGVVSGLAVQYAESWSEQRGGWTTEGYERLLAEVCRVLRPCGSFVFSVNVPEPAWGQLALRSLPGVFGAARPLQYLKKALRMWRYGSWLKREARSGRFHFLPAEEVQARLSVAGFRAIEHRVSYAGQALVFRCRKP